jgi:hypothetical protein
MRHEVAISEIFLNLEAAVARQGWSLPFWLRTSPKARGVSRWVQLDPDDPDGPMVHFAPDVLYCLVDSQQRLRFGTLEYETKDKKIPPLAYRRKLEGHIAFAEQQLFAELLERLVAAYHIPLQADPRTVGMYALTVTSDPELCDELYLACASLPSLDVELLFGTLSDITPEGALSPIWLRAPGPAAIAEQSSLLSGVPTVIHAPLAKHELAVLPRVSLND